MKPENWWLILATFGVLALIALLFLIPIGRLSAHDHNRPELNSWFEHLRSGKGPCCDGADALSIDDPDWENDSGHYRVRLEGQWVDVPDEALIAEPNRDGRALVWPWRKDGKLDQIRCFMPGSLT